MEVIVNELTEVREKYGDERRTEIIEKASELSLEDMIAEEDMVVNITQSGYIKRTPTSLFKIQKRGGKGKKGMTPKEEDVVTSLFIASTHSHILFFTDMGKAYSLKVYDIPQAGRTARGKAIVNILKLSPDEKITAYLPVKEFSEDNFIVMATESGIIKKTDLMSFSNIRSGGIIAVNLDKGDHLIGTRLTDGSKGIFIGTRSGLAIRFNENQVREMGRTARGVKAIKLSKKDRVVSMLALDGNASVLTVTQNGYGKRTLVSQYREQLRGGQGIINLKLTKKTGPVIGISRVSNSDEMMITTSNGKIIRIAMSDVSVIGRNTQGVKLMDIQKGVELTGIAKSAARNVGDEPAKTEDPED
jgi:DNA gyrase subunit A